MEMSSMIKPKELAIKDKQFILFVMAVGRKQQISKSLPLRRNVSKIAKDDRDKFRDAFVKPNTGDFNFQAIEIISHSLEE